MVRKFVSLILVFLMVLSFAACGAPTNSAGAGSKKTSSDGTQASTQQPTPSNKEINLVFAWWGNQVRNNLTQEVLDLYSEQNPGITFDSQPSNYDDYWTKLATAAAGNDLPDVFQINYKNLNQYVFKGLLENLKPYTENGFLDVSNIAQNTIDSGSLNGNIYAISAGINVPALIYNKTLTDELGLTINNIMTTDEFIVVCREIFEKAGVRTDMGYGNAANIMYYFMRGEGISDLFNENGTAFAVSDETAFVPFFKVYETGRNEGWMLDAGAYAEITINSVEQCPMVYFSSPATQSWCACSWSNQLTAMTKAAPEGMKLEFSTWPSANPSKSNYLKPSMFFSVSANSDHKDESVKVVDYLTNSIECNNILLGERGVPVSTAVANAIAPNLNDLGRKEIAFINEVIAPNSSTISPPEPSGATEVFDLADRLVEKVLYGVITAEEASKELYKQGNTIMGN